MSLYYSIVIPENIIQKIKESSDCLLGKSARDLQLKFEKDEYSPHITFIYFGNLLDHASEDTKNEIRSLIVDTELNCFLDFVQISLFGRFVVAEFKPSNELILVKEKLIKNIASILQKNNYNTSIFMSKNYYDGTNFTRSWQPHITIGGIRTPSEDYCSRKNLTVQDCVNGCFKNMKRYIGPILTDMSFYATKLA